MLCDNSYRLPAKRSILDVAAVLDLPLVVTRIGIHRRFFVGIIIKKFKKLSTDYSPQNSIKLLFIKLYDFCLQATSRQKSPLQIFSESPPKRNEILRFRKFQESFVKVSLSPKVLALQSRVSYFISKKTTFLWVFWYSWKCARKRSKL